MSKARKIAIALFALGAWLAPASLANGEAKPAWQLSLIVLPTHLSPGTIGSPGEAPIYEVIATNVGAGDALGPVTLTATLPEGVTPIFNSESPSGQDSDTSSPDPICSKTPGQTVTCTATGPVHPSRNAAVRIPVEVSVALENGEVLEDAEASVSSPGTTTVSANAQTRIDTEPPPFGFLSSPAGLSTLFTNEDGLPSLLAGTHPDQLTINLGFPVDHPGGSGPTTGAGHPRDIVTDLPQGVVVNPNSTAVRCTEAELLAGKNTNPGCPAASQIGMVTVVTEVTGPQPAVSALYNMVPPPGVPAMVAFDAANVGIFVHLAGGVRSDGDYGLSATTHDVLARAVSPIENAQAQLWGYPASSSHDQIRDECRVVSAAVPCAVEPRDTPLLTMPSACSDALTSAAHVRSWEEAEEGVKGLPHTATALATDVTGVPTGVSGCSLLDFDPTLTVRPDTAAAESPTGVEIELEVPQAKDSEPATSNVRDVSVTFPAGMALNPAAADGLQACTPAQIGMTTEVGQTPPHFTASRPDCPDSSKIGSVEVDTPLLDHPVPGAIYVAQPFKNPFGTLLGAYVVIDSPEDGIVAKLAGKTEADPVTGQLTAVFRENPQLPFESFKVNLFGGPRAALRTPSTCGTYATTSIQAPWSGTPPVETTDAFKVTQGPNGRPCTTDEAQMPSSPGFEAGTQTPIAGSYSSFLGRLQRADGDQQLKGVNMTLPAGLTGKLAGVQTCPEAALSAAASRSGAEELASPSCPAGSEIGEVKVGAGAGPAPFYTTGKIYLTGPYGGGPISAAVITPAVAGPFDLGTVVIRAVTQIDAATAVLKVKGEDAPHILQGIPLELRDVRIALNRPQFTLNPTNCGEKAITGEATSLLGSVTPLFSRFQAGGCRGLAYGPKLTIRLFGRTGRGAHPRLQAVLQTKPGEANTARVSVALPRSEFLENAHIGTVCTRVQFAADQCPAKSIYGHARAITPLLDEPLEGPVYLRSSSHKLPDMVVALSGPPTRPIKIELVGRIDSANGGIRSTFDFVPDQPVTKFVLSMFGGRKGLIVNSRNLCAHTYRATAKFDGQNGKAHDFNPAMNNDCKKKGKRANE